MCAIHVYLMPYKEESFDRHSSPWSRICIVVGRTYTRGVVSDDSGDGAAACPPSSSMARNGRPVPFQKYISGENKPRATHTMTTHACKPVLALGDLFQEKLELRKDTYVISSVSYES